MGHWRDRFTFYRDFAFDARRVRMANGDVGDLPASTFAEYVPSPLPPDPSPPARARAESLVPITAMDGACGSISEDDHGDDAPPPPRAPQRVTSCPTLRPQLVHRLYSHTLHVRAKAKLQRDRLLSGPMIEIHVGAARRRWALHRNLLCHHSESLERELSDSRSDALDLPACDPAGFELLVKWLYQGKLDDVADFPDPHQKYDYAVSCHKLYLLCERLDMPQLKNVAMDQYRKGLNQAELVPDAAEIDDIYRQSGPGSPFRRLATSIAARQIMDPESDRDVDTYRQCFVDNPDFAVDLVNAIKRGTGGMLLDDPTELGTDSCAFHDHDAGPNCHVKDKGKGKQVSKKRTPFSDPRSASSAPSTRSVPIIRPPRPPPPKQSPPKQSPPPPRQARPQDGVSTGPLRRRLTSPASSTIEMSPQIATASPPTSPKDQRDKLRKVTPPSKLLPAPPMRTSPRAPGASLQSSGSGSLLLQDSAISELSEPARGPEDEDRSLVVVGEVSPRHGIWDWARLGSGRLGLIGRKPQSDWKTPGVMTSKAANFAVNGALEGRGSLNGSGSLDDFSLGSSISTEPDNEARQMQAAAAKMEGLGIATTSPDPLLFSQTKRSSDDLVASMNGSTPSPVALRDGDANGDISASEASPPTSPSPLPRERPPKTPENRLVSKKSEHNENTPSPHRIPKYRIALASNILSPYRTPVS